MVLGHVEGFEAAFEDSADHLEEALAIAQAIGDPYAEILARVIFAQGAVWHGRYREARESCESGLTTALEHRSPNSEAFMRAALGYLAFAEGRLHGAAAETGRSFEIIAPIMPMMAAFCRGVQAEIAVAESRLADARLFAADAIAVGRETDTTGALVWGLAVRASLARPDGDAHSAEDLLHEAIEVASRSGFRAAMGRLLEALAGTVAQQARFEEAARLLGAAHALRLALGTPRFAAHEPSYEADHALVSESLGAEAFEQAWNEGAAMTLEDALAYARRGRGKRGRPTHGWNSLTPTEARIVELVAEGLTNPQIGEKLFVSARTVQTHLTHVFAKLGISTRAELAAKTSERQVRAPST
jgi:DNA-binding CsgD family transcriptional regulator